MRHTKNRLGSAQAIQTVDKAGCETLVSQPIFLFGVMQHTINLKIDHLEDLLSLFFVTFLQVFSDLGMHK